MIRSTHLLMLFAVAGALAIAGCGGSSGDSTEGETSSGSSSSGMTVTGTSIEGLGTVLVDSEGFTVYAFARDKGDVSSCNGACAESWPPVIAEGTPTAGEGAMSSQLGTTKRKDGTEQVTYSGHPIYTFVDDQSPGEANGNESTAFGGEWQALAESGATVEGQRSAETESSGGGYGY